VRYRYLTNTFDITKTNTILTLINEIPVLELRSTMLSGWNIIFKRFLDIIFSSLLIIIFLPILFIIAILIKLEDSSGPIIFKNKRVGRD
jgi:lipopolysaccharide/colanic/teichoic acid biosynthesis glycosyltransferase